MSSEGTLGSARAAAASLLQDVGEPKCDYLMKLMAEFPDLPESSRSLVNKRLNLLYTAASEEWTMPSTPYADKVDCQPEQQGGGGCSRFTKVQRTAGQYLRRILSFLPEEYRGELWVYAAGYVFLYTIAMLFYMSTFGFICIMIYTILITLLVLRYCKIGPLVSHQRNGGSTDGVCVQISEQAAQFLHPETSPRTCLRWQTELWVYSAGYIYLYTVLMFISMPSIGFICTMIYPTLVAMLTLLYFNIGPLVSCKNIKNTNTCKTTD